ncbi:MAG: efflux transporter outer membrane subunit [Desulfuromonadales bacterium]
MIRGLLFAAILSAMVGCTLHEPSPVTLTVEPPPGYLESRESGMTNAPTERWWLAFQDEQLNRLMEELFRQNLELTQLIARLDQVESLVRINRSAQLPFLSSDGSLSRSQQPGLNDDFIGNTEQLSLVAGFELDLWGKLKARTKAAQLDYAAGQEDLQTLYIGLSARLADLYFLAVEQRAQMALNDQLVASYADTEQRVERRYRLGLAPAIDMYQSRQTQTAARSIRYLYEARLAEAEHAISVLLGRYPEQNKNGSLAKLPAAPDLPGIGIPADLLNNRPDLRAALTRVEAADERVAAAIADRFPTISLSGSYGTLRQDVTAGLLSGEFWSLLGNLSLPIVDGGRRRAEVDRQQAALREAVALYQQTVLNAFKDVEDALANNYATAQRLEQLAATAEATGATLRLSTDRYLAGLDDYLPVLTAQRTDFETRSNLLAAQRQLLVDRISLARALGGSWMQDQMNARLQMEKEAKK